MRLKINYRFLLGLMVVAALVLVGAYFLNKFQVGRNATVYLEQAETAKEENKLGKSVDYYRRYIGFVPSDTNALAEYSKVLLELGKEKGDIKLILDAFGYAEQAIRRMGDSVSDDFLNAQADLAMDLGSIEAAKRHLNSLLEKENDALVKSELEFKLGLCNGSSNKLFAANQNFRAALQDNPKNLKARLALTKLYQDKKVELEKAINDEKGLDQKVRENLLAEISAGMIMDGLLEQAELPQQETEALIAYANFWAPPDEPIDLAKANRAVSELLQRDQAGKLGRQGEELALLRARLLKQNYSKIVEIFEDTLNKNPTFLRLYVPLASAKLESKEKTDVSQVREKFKEGLEQINQLRSAAKDKEELAPYQPKDLNAFEFQFLANMVDLDIRQTVDKTAKSTDDPRKTWNSLEKVYQKIAKESLPIEQEKKSLKNQFLALKNLEARVYALENNWHGVVKTMDEIKKASTDAMNQYGNLNLLARAYEKLGEPDQALIYFQAADKVGGPNVRADMNTRLGMATALANQGRYEDAIRELEQLQSRKEFPAATRFLLADVLYRQNMNLYKSRQQWNRLEAILKQAEKDLPDEMQVRVLHANVLLQSEGAKAAEKYLENLGEKFKKLPEYWVVRSFLEGVGFEDSAKASLHFLKDASIEDPIRNSPELIRYQLGLLAAMPKDKREKEFSDTWNNLTTKARNSKEKTAILPTLANSYLRIGQKEKAISVWEELAQLEPLNPTWPATLFDVSLQDKDLNEAEKYQQILKKMEGTETGTFWRFADIAIQFEIAQKKIKDGKSLETVTEQIIDPAIGKTKQLMNLRNNWDRAYQLEGQLFELKGDKEKALASYEKAHRLDNRNATAARLLIDLLRKEDRLTDAYKVLNNLADNYEPTVFQAGVGKMATMSLLTRPTKDDEHSKRIDEYLNATAPTNSKNHLDHVFRGEILALMAAREENTKKKEKLIADAQESFKKASDKGGETDPTYWLAKIKFVAATEGIEAARNEGVEAKKKLGGLMEEELQKALIPLAEICEFLGDIENATRFYRSALSASETSRDLQKFAAFCLRQNLLTDARTVLKKLETKAKANSDEYFWARRNLAVIKANLDGYTDGFLVAMKELDQNIEDLAKLRKDNLEDKIVKARLMASRGFLRSEAIDLYESIQFQTSFPIEDRFLLCRLYEKENWSEANSAFRAFLVAKEAQDPKYYAYFIRALLEKGDTKNAALYLKQLEKLQPSKLLYAELQGRVLVAQGKPQEAIDALQAFAKEEESKPFEAARLFEVVGGESKDPAPFYAQAEKYYEEYLKNSKETTLGGRIAHALFLIKSGKKQEGIASIQKEVNSDGLNANQLATICSSVIEQLPFGDKGLDTVKALLDKAKPTDPNYDLVRLARAHVASQQGNYDFAEEQYAWIVDQEKSTNVIARNNLAWLLAVRKRDGSRALKILEPAFRQVGPIGDLLDTRATAYRVMGDFQAAIKDLKQAIAISPDPEKHFHLAWALLESGDETRAVEEFQKAMNLGLSEGEILPLEQPAFNRLKLLPKGKNKG